MSDGTVIIEGLPADDPTSMFFSRLLEVGGIIRGEGLKAPQINPSQTVPFF